VPDPTGSQEPDDDPLTRLRGLLAVDAGRSGRVRPAAPRWSVPAAAGLAALVLAAVVAGLLLLRTATTVPSAQTTPVGPVAAVPSLPPSTEDAGFPAPAPGPLPPGATGAAPGTGPPAAPTEVVVHVVGQVRAPGLVRLPAGARVADAVDAAGGLTGEADTARTNLARVVADGEQLVVPRPGEEVPAVPALPASGGGGAPAAGAPGGAGAPVPLATATLADLDALPGLGPVLAQRILDWREEHGGFTSVEELGEVSGIGDALLERLRPLVTV